LLGGILSGIPTLDHEVACSRQGLWCCQKNRE
jgi:hypothetical protein